MMQKDIRLRRAVGIACVISLVIVVLFFAWGIRYMLTGDHTVSIFEDISECEAITASTRTDTTFQSYESPENDEFANGLEYTAFFGGKYKDASCSFEIYAYVFVDEETAAAYYERAANEPVHRDPIYLGHIGMFHADLVVLNGNRAYSVYMPSYCQQEVVKLLAEVFCITIVGTD